ncbi:MAG: hypothetical protein ABSD13_05105 [Candidatus Korobacteraceae bacterium]
MYILRGAEGFDAASLRQGDILEGVPFPLIDHLQLQVLGTIAHDQDFSSLPPISATPRQHRDDKEWTTAIAPVRFGFCAVLSNCCDLEPRNGKVQTQAVNLARLRPIPIDMRNNPERFNSLRANKDPRNSKDPGYIEYFYLEPHELLQGQDWRVHYNQVVTLPTNDITFLLRKKILQLDDRSRVKFKVKLGFTFLRTNEDERKLGLENPWEELQIPTRDGKSPA